MRELDIYFQKREIRATRNLEKFISLRGKTKHIEKLEVLTFCAECHLKAVRHEMLKHVTSGSA